jgi:hypothetical protein
LLLRSFQLVELLALIVLTEFLKMENVARPEMDVMISAKPYQATSQSQTLQTHSAEMA